MVKTHTSFSAVISLEASANDAWLFIQPRHTAGSALFDIETWMLDSSSEFDGISWRKIHPLWICSTLTNFPLLEVQQMATPKEDIFAKPYPFLFVKIQTLVC